MLESYFFVPADKEKFLKKFRDYDADYFVIDLEESVSDNNKIVAFNNIIKMEVDKNTFVRIPVNDNIYTENQINELVEKFNGNIVLPKIANLADIYAFINMLKTDVLLHLIILVENPQCFINLNDILNKYTKHIYAIGFGSQDFCSVMGIKHNLINLDFYKKQLNLYTKAYQIKYIDGVDLNIKDLTVFKDECQYLDDNGCEGKFIIHPRQLDEMSNVKQISELEIKKYLKVIKKVEQIGVENFSVIEVDGEIYEKPHIAKIQKMLNSLD